MGQNLESGTNEDLCRVLVLGHAAHACDELNLPFYLDRIPAGFPSPADDYLETGLDLNKLLVRNPMATFMVRVSGDSMTGAGIHDGDILVVDRSEEAAHGKIVVAAVDGEMTVKRLHLKNGQCSLLPENSAYPPLRIGPDQDLRVWGVVVGVVRKI